MLTDQRYKFQEELEYRILRGLSSEWEKSLWVLDQRYQEHMRIPVFRLRDMERRLGCWWPKYREIGLSRKFVLNYPWGAVCDVLRHEMAHQFADEVLGARNEPKHGPLFKKACYLLRANPESSSHYLSLYDQNTFHTLSDEDKIMLRIQKLLALAESQNEHEAEAAMMKAHELIVRYNVDMQRYKKKRDYISLFLGKPALRHFKEFRHLAHLLTDFYFVQGIWASAYVLEKGKMGRVFEVSGTRKNVEIAHYVYDFMNNHIDLQWLAYGKKNKLNRYRKSDFAVGVICGFRKKLELQRLQMKANAASRALITTKDPMLDDYMSYRYPHTTRSYHRSSYEDENVLNAGKKIGRNMVISKGIRDSEGNSGRFIEHLK